ncbi:helix-turn-helix domain-containing protein [Rathayibacter sp. VKM Ac-2926]|uniref:helix-turn-helix domain-containing protein n=1 Tax=Rathayibacter sp. VKM Ac-2926 TaxID=2929477 RepID=UPI001FB2F439|nr:helix-turn-helix domain-containing protein [Rathayibacter sp. VKM Ac-2926]MCJ1705561.1 helix-turn-helix domain-containing protein [Rathayibacter sp. VKM Ac-2926]
MDAPAARDRRRTGQWKRRRDGRIRVRISGSPGGGAAAGLTLQEAFRRTLDTTPMAYLRRQRLERVREELLVAAPGAVSVTEVATRWGFIHLSRFAAGYRAAFSENPSDTLRS